MSDEPVYASEEQAAPESAFALGELGHLVVGNHGRLLDARRTPITVVDVAPDRGSSVVCVEAFEDSGARWELGLEEIERFQFARSATRAAAASLAELQHSAARFDRDLTIERDPDARENSLRCLNERRDKAAAWLAGRKGRLRIDVARHITGREGHPAVYTLLDEFLTGRDLHELEAGFTQSFVTNPRAGEIVKGHAIVLAELGLSDYCDKAPRDPDLFAGRWSRPRRAEHILWRLAFTQALWLAIGWRELPLYRAAATNGAFQPPRPTTLISATFSRQVADAHLQGGPTTRVSVLWRQRVPVDRVLMTFLETQAMNQRFHEAEAAFSPIHPTTRSDQQARSASGRRLHLQERRRMQRGRTRDDRLILVSESRLPGSAALKAHDCFAQAGVAEFMLAMATLHSCGGAAGVWSLPARLPSRQGGGASEDGSTMEAIAHSETVSASARMPAERDCLRCRRSGTHGCLAAARAT